VVQAAAPRLDQGSRRTAPFEGVVIDWLKEASSFAVARRLALVWDAVDGIMALAAERGPGRRGACEPRRLWLDEPSFQKRHEHRTVVTDRDGGRVLSMLDGRTRRSVDACFSAIRESLRASVEVTAMDRWQPYMDAKGGWTLVWTKCLWL
jgi:transposase